MNYLKSRLSFIKHKFLRPTQIYESIYDIDFGALYDDGIRSIFVDVDNTLISYSEDDVSFQCINLFNAIKSFGFDSVILMSNHSSVERVSRVAKQLDVPGVAFACKPFVFTVRRVMNDYSMNKSETAIIGDQLLTDVLVGSLLNLTTIYVEPINKDDVSLLKKLQYRFQQYILTLS